MEHLINAEEPPEHRAARQRTEEEEAALWFTHVADWDKLNRKDTEAES